MEQEKPREKTFGIFGNAFSGNISAVRVLGLEIARLGDEHDQSVGKDFLDKVREIVPDLASTTDSDTQVSVSLRAGKDQRSESHHEEGTEAAMNRKETRRIDIDDPEQARLLVRAIKAFARRAPVQGMLLRNGAVIILVSFFESLISDLLHLFYGRHPEALPADSRSLSLADLRALGSVEEAEQHLASKEIDSLLRESLDEQLEYFLKRLSVDLSPMQEVKDELTEVFQRRNLLVHNSGVVNRYYLEKVAAPLVEQFGAKEGERLLADPDYLKSAIDIVHVSGFILFQQCWRKWDKSTLKDADRFVVNQLYESLVERDFHLTRHLSRYALRVPFASDEERRIVAINAAIALKELGEMKEMETILDSHDWTACSLKFQTALSVLRGEDDRLFDLLPKAIAAGEIVEANLREWPLFAGHRESDRFKAEIERFFPGSPPLIGPGPEPSAS